MAASRGLMGKREEQHEAGPLFPQSLLGQPLHAAQSDLLKPHLWSCHLPCFKTFSDSPSPSEEN